MKKFNISLILIITFLFFNIPLSARYGKRDSSHRKNCLNNPEEVVNSYPKATLTKKEINDLKFMYEEEKMAHDLYSLLGEKYNSRIFKNITKSEERHMNAIKALLKKYNIKIEKKEKGKFANKEIQSLYNKLKKEGLKNYSSALKVGKTVEITDIKDLEKRLKNVPEDIKVIYSALKKGSENHLKAFTRSENK